jgi:hypothetical protein
MPRRRATPTPLRCTPPVVAVTAMLAEGITLVDYGGFVDLVAQRSTTHSWL